MNKYQITEEELKYGYSFKHSDEINSYLYSLLRIAGIKTTTETHKKARAIYFRFLVSEKYKDKDVDFLNERSREFLEEWAKVSEQANVNSQTSQLMTIESNQHLAAVVRIVLDIAKKNDLVERAEQIKQKRLETK